MSVRLMPATMGHLLRPLFLAMALLPLAACHQAVEAPVAEDDTPQIQQDTVVFSETADNIHGLVSQPITPSTIQVETFPGRLVWDEDRTVRVFPAVNGRVLSINGSVGSDVAKGSVLATLTAPDYGTMQAESDKASADNLLAQKSLSRQKELLALGIIARKDYEQAEADAKRAQVEVQRTQQRLKDYGGNNGIVDQKYPLLSPIAGRVVERNINTGMEVRTDTGTPTPLFVVTATDHLWVLLDVNENRSSLFHAGLTLNLHSQALPDHAFKATVTQVADFVDPVSRTVKVRAEVSNPEHLLKAEMYVTADVSHEESMGLYVPAKSVFLNEGQFYLFVDQGHNHFQRRHVQVATEVNGSVPVISGLNAGEHVVTEGNLYLQQIMQNAASLSTAAQPTK